jgi:hypothetical protein
MPYIKQERRNILKPKIEKLYQSIDDMTESDINFIITLILHKYLLGNGLYYKNINAFKKKIMTYFSINKFVRNSYNLLLLLVLIL